MQAFFIRKILQHRCFPVNIAKVLRTPVLKNICEWLLLNGFERWLSWYSFVLFFYSFYISKVFTIGPSGLKIIFKSGISFLCLISLIPLCHSSFTWKPLLAVHPFTKEVIETCASECHSEKYATISKVFL